jgi:hypothetical protein
VILARPAAITLMIFYYFIPFQIVAGAPNSLGKLRPFVLSPSATLIAFGFYRLWQKKPSKSKLSMWAKWTFSL